MPVTSFGASSTSDTISFDQNWHHLCSTAAGGKGLSNNTQIRVISLMESEICTKMLKKLSEKLRAKFPATTSSYSMVKIVHINNAFLEVFLCASKPSGRSIIAAKRTEKEKKRGEKKIQKSKSLKTQVTFSSKTKKAHARAECPKTQCQWKER